MMLNNKLKAFLLGTLFVAIVSLVVMFYYSVEFTKYTQIGVKYVALLKTDYFLTNGRTRGISGEKFGNATSSRSNASRHIDVRESLIGKKLGEFIDVIRGVGSSKEELTQTPKTETVGKQEEVNKTTPTPASNEQTTEEAKELPLCPSGSKQVGPLFVDKAVPKMEDLEKEMSSDFNGWVSKGGSWKPTDCKAKVKMALIIPFRKRYEQLSIFLRHMHPVLRRQNLFYRIFVIEQAGDTPFNRAMLFNIGYKEALKFDQFDCFIFHDVDLIPEDDRNEYSCPTSPRHMSVAVDKFQYRLPYTTIFGGVGALSREHFELVNGFSNQFWGWGGEDDDLYIRIASKGLKLSRPSMQLGRYTMIQIFHQSAKADEDRFTKLQSSAARMATDGINSLKYTLEKVTEHLLYTLVTVDVKEAVGNKR